MATSHGVLYIPSASPSPAYPPAGGAAAPIASPYGVVGPTPHAMVVPHPVAPSGVPSVVAYPSPAVAAPMVGYMDVRAFYVPPYPQMARDSSVATDPFLSASAPSQSSIQTEDGEAFEMTEFTPSSPSPPSTSTTAAKEEKKKRSSSSTNQRLPHQRGAGKDGPFRCKRCTTYFRKSSNGPDACRYHPGKFRAPPTVSPIMMSAGMMNCWTCCKSIERNAPGCKTGSHSRDKRTSHILRAFDQLGCEAARDNAELKQSHALSSAEVDSTLPRTGVLIQLDGDGDGYGDDEKKRGASVRTCPSTGLSSTTKKAHNPNKPDVRIEDGVVLVTHNVKRHDTLSGLALRYGVTAASIKHQNRLMSDNIYQRPVLLIPNPTKTPDDSVDDCVEKSGKKEILERTFRIRTGVPAEEALYYLSSADYDLNEALKQHREDMEWERNHSKKL